MPSILHETKHVTLVAGTGIVRKINLIFLLKMPLRLLTFGRNYLLLDGFLFMVPQNIISSYVIVIPQTCAGTLCCGLVS
ncbi:hypothetical protein ANPL_02530 [Anaplasma platys]|uniref:Uncharacterized protein n=1 Tax=Anaplasma platys TaxID=949 RepID=A0A858PYA2_9RICK|nr:hypothetical protein ANPL_02530 [Anaplasma platys]